MVPATLAGRDPAPASRPETSLDCKHTPSRPPGFRFPEAISGTHRALSEPHRSISTVFHRLVALAASGCGLDNDDGFPPARDRPHNVAWLTLVCAAAGAREAAVHPVVAVETVSKYRRLLGGERRSSRISTSRDCCSRSTAPKPCAKRSLGGCPSSSSSSSGAISSASLGTRALAPRMSACTDWTPAGLERRSGFSPREEPVPWVGV